MDEFQSKYTGEEIENKLDGTIVYNRDMNLSEEEKARARSNIGVTENSGGGGTGGGGTVTESFKILGYFSSLAALQQNVPNPEPGDAYGVGSAAPYDIYIWDGYNSRWVNNGPIQGPAGEDAEVSKGSVTSALGYTPVKSVNGKTGEAITLNANDVGAVAKSTQLDGSRTYYVDAVNGDDSNNGTSQNTAFATLKKALQSFPKNMGGQSVKIYLLTDLTLADGEKIEIGNFANGTIEIRSLTNDFNPTISGKTSGFGNGIIAITNTPIDITLVRINIKQKGTGPGIFLNTSTGFVKYTYATITGAKNNTTTGDGNNSSGVYYYSPVMAYFENMTFKEWHNSGVRLNGGYVQFVYTNSLSNNGIGLAATNGAIVSGRLEPSNNSTNYEASNGGRIFTGAQTSVPNY